MHTAKTRWVQYELAWGPCDWYRLQAHRPTALCSIQRLQQGMHLPACQAASGSAHLAAPLCVVNMLTRLCLASSFTFRKIIFSFRDFSTRASEAAAGRPQMAGCLHACMSHCRAITSS